MKTQLLEDIGQSATISLTPSKPAGNAAAGTAVQDLAPAGKAQPAKPRSAPGVWRQKPAEEPLLPATPAEEAAPLELNKVIEELAALEAQFVAPAQQHEPAAPPAAPRHALPASPVESRHEPGIVPDEALHLANPAPNPVPNPVPNPASNPVPHHVPPHAANPAPSATAQQKPVFDFTPPAPAPAASFAAAEEVSAEGVRLDADCMDTDTLRY